MKKILFFTCMLLACHGLAAQDLLSGKYTAKQLSRLLIPQAKWEPFPHTNNRAGWTKADPVIGKAVIQKAEGYLNYEWPGIPAVKSLLIVRNGNRSEYQEISNKKRLVLGTLLLAEVYENKGRFIDPIINGVWSICEESFWGASAHLPHSKAYAGLMDVSAPFVELFSAETGTLLAWVDYFVGEKLDSVSPQIRKRIYYETSRRIFEPLMTIHHGWMSTNANGRRPNNWNPWICSNWLNSVLLLEKDDKKRTTAVYKLLGVLDEFLNPYPADGGCDEGPGYWGAAAASLYDNISLLNLASNNAFAYMYEDRKVVEMGRFIYRAQISERYFLDFADADPQPRMPASMIYRFGKDIKDPDMMKFGAYYLDGEDQTAVGGYHFFRRLFSLFMQEEFNHAAKGLLLPAEFWWPDLEVMIARDGQGSTKGFFVAAKGGNNDESHNHNDIGNYVVYYDGMPVLIDVGRGTYTAKTFSSKRYDIWYNRSDYHNTPTVNGYTQQAGGQFKAEQVFYQSDSSYSQVTMDIGASYPAAAGIEKWERSIRLNRQKSVEVEDLIKLKTGNSVTEHLMTCYPVDVENPGILVIHQPSKDLYLQYPSEKFTISIEKVPLVAMEDQGVKQKWGDNIYRINLKAIGLEAKDHFIFSVTAK
ncbi:Heparinase II/III-like protein [Chitinophaga sp. CF118]|uniref:heparinase II/III domain-containing protein n=1 Tax=Chitinophaga sp. CF118 TaxID=1884367 RepID=UPI0008E8451F|nr:heparinase II/III family protein [Chitinophaga sp. CF118]SFE44328.1 Heparinase II/III-like protein [Chitinophaga sp. CF118]